MHGLINRAIQSFVTDSYGSSRWDEAAEIADLGFTEFEAMLSYDDDLTSRVLDAVGEVLGRDRFDLMEDIGMYLVSHPNMDSLRRLLRFGGVDFVDFLQSLDDLPDRARLAVSDLVLPPIELRDLSDTRFRLICGAPIAGYGHLLMGILRVMADDYGTLAMLSHEGEADGRETVSIVLVDAEFAHGRAFQLGVPTS